ncbi:hypothetical protein [Amycolatopsis magusensis]|uniref:hypothetical protein n=1 Tax=Amycolatopsis magusensis TaxID=882444 RepID=UPI003C2C420C
MTTRRTARICTAFALASTVVLGGGVAAAADTYTRVFTGSGYSDWGFALDYARGQAYQKALADGFVYEQCVETGKVVLMFEAHVTWECTREA